MTAAEPIRERVTVYRCPFCRRSRSRRAPAVKHARHCFKNPERMPREGELTSVGQTGRLVDWGESSALPGGMSWLEWDEHETMPPWWPGVGKVFDGAVWRDVPGYSVGRETGAHGCAGGAPPLATQLTEARAELTSASTAFWDLMGAYYAIHSALAHAMAGDREHARNAAVRAQKLIAQRDKAHPVNIVAIVERLPPPAAPVAADDDEPAVGDEPTLVSQ